MPDPTFSSTPLLSLLRVFHANLMLYSLKANIKFYFFLFISILGDAMCPSHYCSSLKSPKAFDSVIGLPTPLLPLPTWTCASAVRLQCLAASRAR